MKTGTLKTGTLKTGTLKTGTLKTGTLKTGMLRCLLSSAVVVSLVGCAPDDSSPEGAVKLFLRAVAMRDGPQMFELLAPVTQARLKKMAELATAQTSGRRRLAPDELLAAGLDKPRYR
ncbi:MAG: hypothetical protein JRH20_31135, partial [Deltaproteobacteria bacterium]|nr:hypothetical protein [Deltaproteobacteria bacterium]